MSESNANSLHPSIVALVSLAANIASNHPKQGLCQVDRLKEYGVAKEQIDAVIEIARHIRDEATQLSAQALDASLAPGGEVAKEARRLSGDLERSVRDTVREVVRREVALALEEIGKTRRAEAAAEGK